MREWFVFVPAACLYWIRRGPKSGVREEGRLRRVLKKERVVLWWGKEMELGRKGGQKTRGEALSQRYTIK